MKGIKPDKLTDWIKNQVQSHPQKVSIRDRHIEKERRWREISVSDVKKVLCDGKIHKIDPDGTVKWRGKTTDGKELELVIVAGSKADEAIVKTAYDPHVDDDVLKKEWLKNHPDYEELPNGTVGKKIEVKKF